LGVFHDQQPAGFQDAQGLVDDLDEHFERQVLDDVEHG
jgi:hypothetical protein